MRHAELDQQLLVGRSLLQRIELDAVDVLQQRVAQEDVVAGPPDDRGDPAQPGALRRAPAPLAHDELVAPVAHLADHDRLQQPELTDRVFEFGQGLLVEDAARLLRVRLDRGDVDLAVVGRAGRCFTWNIGRDRAGCRPRAAEEDGGGIRRGLADRWGRGRRGSRLHRWWAGRNQGGETPPEPASPLDDLPLTHRTPSLRSVGFAGHCADGALASSRASRQRCIDCSLATLAPRTPSLRSVGASRQRYRCSLAALAHWTPSLRSVGSSRLLCPIARWLCCVELPTWCAHSPHSSSEHAGTDGCAGSAVPLLTTDRSEYGLRRPRRSPGPRRRSSSHHVSRGRSRARSGCSPEPRTP